MSGAAEQACGLLVVDKPAGVTSHDVVARVRRILGLRRVGHAGTLDPDATGVLLVGVGRATRLLRYLSGLDKEYEGDVVLGTATDTLDSSGAVVGSWDMSEVTLQDVRKAAAGLTGTISQVPPMVSAIKVGGRRLHELARTGVVVERAAREVRVDRFFVEATATPLVFHVQVTCGSGTYVRTLAADLGEALGGGAHLKNLRRTRSGPFDELAAVPLDQVSLAALRAPLAAVTHLERVVVSKDIATYVAHGRPLERSVLGVDGEGPWAIVGPEQRLLAVYERADARDGEETVRPSVVVAPQT